MKIPPQAASHVACNFRFQIRIFRWRAANARRAGDDDIRPDTAVEPQPYIVNDPFRAQREEEFGGTHDQRLWLRIPGDKCDRFTV